MKNNHAAEANSPHEPTSTRTVSFYRHYASRCEVAARNAPNERMRAELSKMVYVWREFAAEHEQALREGRDINVCYNPSLKGWM